MKEFVAEFSSIGRVFSSLRRNFENSDLIILKEEALKDFSFLHLVF